ncbi:hypothetical protein GEA64_00900 [Photorhabdus khanii]|uniref:Glycosyltransferase family 1 protein n=1 Tax=Photorhabdus khanii TaxID=1004150 RepID=A0A7C9GGW1_9GAMM|nr:hypothetical protein [Photorhabdus khanii]MQL46636.1 hypothetical protein [Photorhabdus khanii]
MNIMITNFHTGNGGGHTTYIMNIVKYFDYNKGKLFVACPPESRLYKELISSGFNNVFPLYFPNERLKPPSLDGDFDFNFLTYARLRGAWFDDFQSSAPKCANPPTSVGGS